MSTQTGFGKEKLNKSVKLVLAALWIAVFALLLFFVWKYFRNAGIIRNYNDGNKAYKSENYELAEAYYETALGDKPSKKKECRIRINEALSITKPITPESVSNENLEQSIAELERAKEILTKNGCAHEDDDNGHSYTAQILKNEIDDYIKWLRDNVKPPDDDSESDSQSDDTDSESKDSQDEKKQQSEMDKLQKKMDEVQNKGLEERNRDLSDYKNYGDGYEYYGRKNW